MSAEYISVNLCFLQCMNEAVSVRVSQVAFDNSVGLSLSHILK